MSPKRGRPQKADARRCDINIRLTEEELNDIQTVADILGISRTDAIVQSIEEMKKRLNM